MDVLKFEDFCVREKLTPVDSDPLDFFNAWKIHEKMYKKYCKKNGFETENYTETAVFIF